MATEVLLIDHTIYFTEAVSIIITKLIQVNKYLAIATSTKLLKKVDLYSFRRILRLKKGISAKKQEYNKY